MPLDAEPVPLGTIVLSKLVDGREVARYLTPSNAEDFADGRPRYTSHFSTCPDAAQWRRK